MKILHSIFNMGVKKGGTTTCTYNLIKGLNALNIPTDVLCYDLEPGDKYPEKADFYKTVKLKHGKKFLYSKEYYKYLLDQPDYDLYHCNGLWQYPTHATASYARKVGKPYLISPHGMLYPEALKSSSWIKYVSSIIWQNRDLMESAAIHVTCMEELNVIRDFGLNTPVAVIPNAIDIECIDLPIVEHMGKIRIGFLGRLHPRKKVESLITALSKLPRGVNIELVVIGGGDLEYELYLKELAKRNNLQNQVTFYGFLEGKEKDDAINSLSYLAVPSDFENFGMIIAEALVKGIPVIASKGTPWQELNTSNCGWWVNNDVDTITDIFHKISLIPESDRISMGMRGKELIKNNYSVKIVAQKMACLYEHLLYNSEKPDFVF